MKKPNIAEQIWKAYNYKDIPEEDCEAIIHELDDQFKAEFDEASRALLLPYFQGYKKINSKNVTRLLSNLMLSREGNKVL